MLMLTWLVAMSTLLQTAQSPPAAPPPAAQAAPKPTTVDVHVTDRTGATLEAAHVIAEGPMSRDGVTDRSGAITFKNMTAGTYRLRIEHSGFFTLEKEVTLKAGVAGTADAALTAAPPPPPPPEAPAPVAPLPPTLVAGDPRVLSIPDLAEKEILSKDTNRETAIGCSGATAVRLILTRDAIAAHTHVDADETLYVVAGEATLKLGGQDYALAAGSLAIVPRGAEHTLARKGKNPVIFLSTLNGPTCVKK